MNQTSFLAFKFVAHFKRKKDEKDSIDFWLGYRNNFMCKHDCNDKLNV
jgi:hypothetical protein